MAVQAGEGTIELFFGSISIPAGAKTLSGYLARPDGEGEWPTVLVFGPEPRPVSSVKNICRILARHGIAALAPDMTDDSETNALIASRVARFMTNPSGSWSNAQFGYGVLAFGNGILDASSIAARDGRVLAIVSISSTLGPQVVENLAAASIPGLWIGSRSDGSVDVDVSVAAQIPLPQTSFVIHADADEGFWDDGADGFDEQIAADTADRLISFLADELPPRV